MRLLEGVVLNKVFVFAVLLLGGLSPPDSTGAVTCWSCEYDTRKDDTDRDENCFEGGVPMRVMNKPNEVDCELNSSNDETRCLTALNFGLGPNNQDYALYKICIPKGDIHCFEKTGWPKNSDGCYQMTEYERLNVFDAQCNAGRKRRSLGYDGTGNPRLGKRQATEHTYFLCICTGDHCGEYAPESLYQAAGLTKPPSPGGGGGGGGGGGDGDGSGSSSLKGVGVKWTTVVGWTVVTLALAVVGIRN